MKNKIAGILVIVVALLIGFITYMFNNALTKIVNESCTHGPSCPMWGTIDFQTNIGLGIMVFILAIGVYLIFFGKEEKIVTQVVKEQIKPKEVTKDNYAEVMKQLADDEKKVLETIIEAKGTIFQSDLVEKTKLTKVKITRILDKLEGQNVVERKRRGMTNVVILKN